jgi:glycosyltransferase involved in cell wall biosynthesis
MKQSSSGMIVAHLTSVHPRYDTRIFLKECRSLASAGHQVTLVVADGLGDEEKDGVRILDVGKPRNRLERMTGATRRVMARAQAIGADIYHLHDPELLPVGLALKWKGSRVIFDAHEDAPRQILSKFYLHPIVRYSISWPLGVLERYSCRRFDKVIAATPAICEKFVELGIPSININNFPLLGELETEAPWDHKQKEVCYIGGITSIRGIRQVVAAMAIAKSGVRLNLGGPFPEKEVRSDVEQSSGWSAVNELGFVSRPEMRDVLARSLAGIVTFLPEPNHIAAQPNKMFEYMSAGIPVIASNFPLWREIVEGNECGLCVDPLDPSAIAAAIDHLVDDPDRARRMGENGRRAVQERFNWSVEERSLLRLYEELLPQA